MVDEKNKMIVWAGSIPKEETKLDDGIKEPKTRVKIDLLPAFRISQLQLWPDTASSLHWWNAVFFYKTPYPEQQLVAALFCIPSNFSTARTGWDFRKDTSSPCQYYIILRIIQFQRQINSWRDWIHDNFN